MLDEEAKAVQEVAKATGKGTDMVASAGAALKQLLGDSLEQFGGIVSDWARYHQMRSIWPAGPYTLNGEVDKAGHRKLRELRADKSKPDLLVHIPGDMEGTFR